jgi:hypothetical protein
MTGKQAPAGLDVSVPNVARMYDYYPFAIVHFIAGDTDPAGIVARLRDALAPGSYLALTHIGSDFFPDKQALAKAVAVREGQRAGVAARPRSDPRPFRRLRPA